jgi:Fcf1
MFINLQFYALCIGPAVFGAMLIAKQFPLHKCGHDSNPLTGSKCLLSMVRKKENRFGFIVTCSINFCDL